MRRCIVACQAATPKHGGSRDPAGRPPLKGKAKQAPPVQCSHLVVVVGEGVRDVKAGDLQDGAPQRLAAGGLQAGGKG